MTTPMRRQYLALKKQFPDTILFFRLGDFYETFDRDAEIVAEVCDVVLTSRPVGKNQRVPLAGVPYHSVEPYIAKLIAAGYKVAIAEQEGSTPPPGQKLVERTVRRVITAGTVVEPELLPEDSNNYLAAVLVESDQAGPAAALKAGLAYADITTGEFATTQLTGPDVERLLREELARLQPAEVLVPEEEWGQKEEGQGIGDRGKGIAGDVLTQYMISTVPGWQFEEETARRALLEQFEVETLAGFGCEHLPLAVRAAGALIQYLRQTQRDSLPHLTGLRTYSTSEFMILDEATRRNLELTQTIRTGSKKGSLLGILDVTRTPMGSRLLRRWLNQPLLDLEVLNARLDAVQAWLDDTATRSELRSLLRQIGDLERWANRAAQGIARPQDLVGIRQALRLVPEIERINESANGKSQSANPQTRKPANPPSAVRHSPLAPLPDCQDVLDLLESAIAEEPPATLDKGGVIRQGFSAELDGIAVAARDARNWVASLERSERERTGIKSLKVGFNKVFGYYIEVTKANSHLVPDNYIRKQTLVNAERYITPELKEYESLILNAEERQLELEREIYRQVVAQVGAAAPRLLRLAQALAELDVVAALAEVAANNRYVRPELADDGVIEIVAGRHPVVEVTQRDEPFQPNDVRMSPEESILIITGPNMSGKCLAGDTLLLTEQGLCTLASLQPRNAPIDRFSPLKLRVDGRHGPVESSHFYRGGVADTIRIRTRLGFELEGTPEHRIWVRSADGQERWRRLDELAEDDYVAIRLGAELWGTETRLASVLEHELDRRARRYQLPTELTSDLAYLMGLLTGDGTLTYDNAITFSTADRSLGEEFIRIVGQSFGYRPGLKNKGRDYFVTSKQIRLFLAKNGLGYCRAWEKEVPACILRAPRPMVVAFLQGLFDTDGTAEKRYGNVRLSLSSPMLVRQVRMLLLNMGILGSIQEKPTKRRTSYRLSINGEHAIRFHQEIGLRLQRKAERAQLASHQSGVPCPELEKIWGAGFFYDPIDKVTPGKTEVYDLCIPDGHAFNAEGLISHNSTYLRQVALITLMAQIGSFVPADRAHIGLVDRIFTRIGAQDEIHAGQSTFMVEMVEAANILHHATNRSLIIFDELGRGTSTYDGLAIAWAVIEYIHNHPHLRAKTLFATHYHELTELAERLPHVVNYNVAVAEEGDTVVFLHKIVPGAADRSYGIHVAQLAGLPRPVIHRAEEILEDLEAQGSTPGGLLGPASERARPAAVQLTLFGGPHPVVEALKQLDINTLSPLEALNKLYELQRLARDDG